MVTVLIGKQLNYKVHIKEVSTIFHYLVVQ